MNPQGPDKTRLLGKPRNFSATTLPQRFRAWHAPRANRWEHIHILQGPVETEWLHDDGLHQLTMANGQSCWVAPGQRWRIRYLDADAQLHWEVHSDQSSPASVPQSHRGESLDKLPVVRIHGDKQLQHWLSALPPGSQRLLQADFNITRSVRHGILESGRGLYWHPLEADTQHGMAVIGRVSGQLDLCNYLARDHIFIESALTGALQGSSNHCRWFRNLLDRHLMIEEQCLFPVYVQSGGHQGHVRGLRNEHDKLRTLVQQIDDPDNHRALLLLLDAHDEKEEQIVYPDIVRCTQQNLPELTLRVASCGLMNAT